MVRLMRLLRLVRVVRATRLTFWLKDSSGMVRLGESMVLLSLSLLGLLGGTLGMAYYEPEHGNGLHALVLSFWTAVFSFTSQQYQPGPGAPNYPVTVGGKLAALLVVVCGIGFVAVLTGTAAAIMTEKLKEGTAMLDRILLEELEDHVVICGWNSGVESTLRELSGDARFTNRDVVVLSDHPEMPDLSQFQNRNRIHVLQDDFTRVSALTRANLHKAAVAIIVTDTGCGRSPQDADARAVLAALTIEKIRPEVFSCAELANSENESHLRMGNVDAIISTGELTGSLLAQAALDATNFRIFQDLLHPTKGCFLDSEQVAPELVGLTFEEVLTPYRVKFGKLPIAVRSGAGKVLLNPPGYRLEEGDALCFIHGASSC